MKNLKYFLITIMVVISACTENPVKQEPAIDMTNTWEPAFYSTKTYTVTGDAWGKTLIVGYGDFSDCSFIRIKINYVSYYKDYCRPPSIFVTDFGGGYLRAKKYSTFDTIVGGPFNLDSIKQVGVEMINAKLQFDTVIIMKGYKNF